MSLWQKGAIPGQQPRFALGCWLPGRNLMSPAFVPLPKARNGLRYKKNVWYTCSFNITVSGRTAFARVSVAPNFRLMMILGNATQPTAADGQGSFQAQIFDTARRQSFMLSAIGDPTLVGIGQHPFILKNPYSFKSTAPILVKVTNRTAAANKITVVLYGVSD